MIRFLRAFAWLRWRLLVNGLRGERKRDTMETWSRLAGLIVPAAIFLAFLLLGLLLALAAFLGGRMLGEARIEAAPVLLAARLVLLAVLVVLVLVAVGGSLRGVVSSFTRLLLLPLPRNVLHRVEVLAGLADPWVAFIIPGLLLLPAGLLTAGKGTAAIVMLAGGVALICVLATLGAVLSFLLHWLLRDRRRSEIVALLFMILVSLSSLPAIWFSDHHGRGRPAASPSAPSAARGLARLDSFDRRLPAWTRAIPSELYGRSLRAAIGARPAPAWAGVAALSVEAALLFQLSAAVHRRLLETPEGVRRRRRTDRLRVSRHRLPALSDAGSAVALAQVRSVLRTVRGKLTVCLNAPVLLILAIAARRFPGEPPFGGPSGLRGEFLLAAGVVLSLMSLQSVLVNQFASDRAGLTLQFLSPVSDLDLVRGRMAGGAVLLLVSALPCLVVALAMAPSGRWPLRGAIVIGGAAAYRLAAPLGILLAALFPKAADPSRLGAAGNPHPLASLLGLWVVLTALTPPAMAVIAGASLTDRPGLSLVLSLLWAAAALLISHPLIRLAAAVVGRRRETLLLVAGAR